MTTGKESVLQFCLLFLMGSFVNVELYTEGLKNIRASRPIIKSGLTWDKCARLCGETPSCHVVSDFGQMCVFGEAKGLPHLKQYQRIESIKHLSDKDNNFSQMVYDTYGYFIIHPNATSVTRRRWFLFSSPEDKIIKLSVSYSCDTAIGKCPSKNTIKIFCSKSHGKLDYYDTSSLQGDHPDPIDISYKGCQTIFLQYNETKENGVTLNVSLTQGQLQMYEVTSSYTEASSGNADTTPGIKHSQTVADKANRDTSNDEPTSSTMAALVDTHISSLDIQSRYGDNDNSGMSIDFSPTVVSSSKTVIHSSWTDKSIDTTDLIHNATLAILQMESSSLHSSHPSMKEDTLSYVGYLAESQIYTSYGKSEHLKSISGSPTLPSASFPHMHLPYSVVWDISLATSDISVTVSKHIGINEEIKFNERTSHDMASSSFQDSSILQPEVHSNFDVSSPTFSTTLLSTPTLDNVQPDTSLTILSHKNLIIIISCCLGAVVLVIMASVVVILRRRKNKFNNNRPQTVRVAAEQTTLSISASLMYTLKPEMIALTLSNNRLNDRYIYGNGY